MLNLKNFASLISGILPRFHVESREFCRVFILNLRLNSKHMAFLRRVRAQWSLLPQLPAGYRSGTGCSQSCHCNKDHCVGTNKLQKCGVFFFGGGGIKIAYFFYKVPETETEYGSAVLAGQRTPPPVSVYQRRPANHQEA